MRYSWLLLILVGCASTTETVLTPVRFDLVRVKGQGRTPWFWIGAREVTWAEFDRYAESDARDGVTRPSRGKSYLGLGGIPPEFLQPELPVTNLRWHAAVAYCEWLSRRTGAVYRLPTEIEWELACGTPPADSAWTIDNSGDRIHAGGGKTRHASGAWDLTGNVLEYALESDRPPDFEPVLMGGAWNTSPERRRTAPFDWDDADPNRPRSTWWFRDGHSQGFRVVRVGEPAEQAERDAAAAQLRITGLRAAERTVRFGSHVRQFTRVTGTLRNAGTSSLDEVILKVYFLDGAGKPHVEDSTLPQGPRATFNLAFPVLASSRHPGPQREPLRPGESRDFSADLPLSYDPEVEGDRAGAAVGSLRLSR
jgi:hypothetical protein